MRVNTEILESLKDLGEPGGENPLHELIDLYLEDAPRSLDRLQKACELQDSSVVKQAAHALKGSSANMGAEQLALLCRELEAAAQRGNLSSANGLCTRIREEFEEVKAVLLTHRVA